MTPTTDAEYHDYADHMLDDYILGTLASDDRLWMTEHIRDCAPCQDEVATLDRAVQALPFAAPEPHIRLSDGVWTRIAQSISTSDSPPPEEPAPVPLVFTTPALPFTDPESSPFTPRQRILIASLMVVSLIVGILLAQLLP